MEGFGGLSGFTESGTNLHLFDCCSKALTCADVTTGTRSVIPRGLEQRELVLAILKKKKEKKKKKEEKLCNHTNDTKIICF